MIEARLPHKGPHVDQARGQAFTAALDHICGFRCGDVGADLGNQTVFDDQPAHRICAGGRVQDAGVGVGGDAGHGRAAKVSRQAMRTATPISTCSAIALRSMSSARSVSISTPRFMGPGCRTKASGFAAASFSASKP